MFIANITVATSESWSESWKDKNTGERREKTEWHRGIFFGGVANIVEQYLRMGSKVYIEGKLQTRKWQDKSGQDRYTTEVVVDGFNSVMQMLDSRGAGGDVGGESGNAPPPQATGNDSFEDTPF